VAPGKTEALTVTEERVLSEQVALTSFNDEQVRFFINSTVSSAKVKQALAEALKLREALAKTQREVQEQERQLKTITDDQARLRANLKEMPSTAAAYKRYLDKFDAQETQIEALQADIKKLQGTEHNQRKEYEAFLNSLDVE
jgi:septal ring factor EnvC (AmiA/AmiB activator)